MKKTTWIVGGLVLILGAGTVLVLNRSKSNEPKFRKAKVDRGDVIANVTATGTLSAVTTVHIGSQVSGIIARLLADFNSEVKKGQLLAELDPTPFQQTVDQRRADLEKSKVELRNTQVSLTRAKNLFAQQLLAQSDLDAAQTNHDSAAAAVAQSQAAVKQAETNLSYTKINSPIDGVVVDRQYDVGQTVAASFQAPVLFTIAQDLTKMQVLTNIDESDVGRIQVDQVASFTVDAFPEATFKGRVSQIRLSPVVVQNVVTYPVILDVPNPDLRLKPGMTANVQVPVDVRRDVLRVANAALRFKPDPNDLVPEAKVKPTPEKPEGPAPTPGAGGPAPTPGERRPREAGGGRTREGGGGGRGAGGPAGGRPAGGPRPGVVYVETEKAKLKPVAVRTLMTDGNVTAVESKELKEGDEVVIGLATLKVGGSGSSGGPGGGGGRRPF